MPIHDWSRVPAGTFHDLHVSWIPKIKNVLNRGVLPKGYYAMAEQVAGTIIPDVLTLREATADQGNPKPDDTGGTAVAERPPQVSITARLEQSIYARLTNRVVIKHALDDRVVALVEVVSAGNKSSAAQFRRFVDKATAALEGGVHLLIIDLQPPTRRDPHGIHGAIWDALGGDEEYHVLPQKPLTLVSYAADLPIQAFVEPAGVGDVLPVMPLFLTATRYVEVPLEASYMEAFGEIPDRARLPLEEPAAKSTVLTAHGLLGFAKSLEGAQLTTAARKQPFALRVLADGIEFIPSSSGEPRLVSHDTVQRVCDEYERSRSSKPGNYQSITFDASYLLALIARFVESHSG